MAIKKGRKVILGLDISMRGTGISVISNSSSEGDKINNSSFRHLYSSVIYGRVQKDLVTYKEVNYLQEVSSEVSGSLECSPEIVFNSFIKKVFDKFQITHIIIEGYSYKSIGRVFDIAEFTGVIKYLIRENYKTIPRENIFIVPPTKVKEAITNYGNASKESIIYNVKNDYGIEFIDDNMADAFSLGITYAKGKLAQT